MQHHAVFGKRGFVLAYLPLLLAVFFGVHDDRPSTPTERFFIWSSFGLVACWLTVKGILSYRIRKNAAVLRPRSLDADRQVMAHVRGTLYFQVLLTLIYGGICIGFVPRPGDFLPDGLAMGFACALLTGAVGSIWIVAENLLFGFLGWKRNVSILAFEFVVVTSWIMATSLPDNP